MSPSRTAYIKAKQKAINLDAAYRDPMNMGKVSKAEPKGVVASLTGAKKKFFENIAEERNQIADNKMTLNRLPNAATRYQDFPNNR